MNRGLTYSRPTVMGFEKKFINFTNAIRIVKSSAIGLTVIHCDIIAGNE